MFRFSILNDLEMPSKLSLYLGISIFPAYIQAVFGLCRELPNVTKRQTMHVQVVSCSVPQICSCHHIARRSCYSYLAITQANWRMIPIDNAIIEAPSNEDDDRAPALFAFLAFVLLLPLLEEAVP
jgi:hypothetical protein